MGMKTWHENRVLGDYSNRMRIKQKHFGAVHLCQKCYAQNYIKIIQHNCGERET